METHDFIPPDLLDRYLAEEATTEERALVQAWLDGRPLMAAAMTRLREDADASPVAVHVSADWRRVQRAIAGDDVEQKIAINVAPVAVRRLRQTGGSRRWASVAGIAAAVLLAFGLSWWALRQDPSTHTVAAVPAREVITKRGERATLELTDGTRVILAPESRLRVPAAYNTMNGRGARDLELAGEAYFEVAHDAARPFRVRTATGTAEDLGTEFVVTAYAETQGMRVLVASGEVALHRNTRRGTETGVAGTAISDTMRSRPLALLHPGDLAQLDAMGTLHVREGVNARQRMAWTSGRLVFTDTPFPEALAVLQRWYDVEFRLGDPALAAGRVNADFERASVQNVMEAFEVVLHVRAERHGRVVTLFPRSHQP